MLIIRRLNCINTASGIVTLCRWPFGAQVARELTETSRIDGQMNSRLMRRLNIGVHIFMYVMNGAA
jgi:hypothetical protein